jgi:predicted O-methyltransferase YrrM
LLIARHSFGHGIHSPFLFSFVNRIIFYRKDNKKFDEIDEYYKYLKKSKQKIEIEDKGAGSKYDNSKIRKISEIAKNSSTKKKYGKILARIVEFMYPTCIIELGTALGVGTSYLALNLLPESTLYSIEGSENLHSFTHKNCNLLKNKNIRILKGNFDDVLPELLETLEIVDLVFIDGNHRKAQTIKYFQWLIPKLHNDSVIVFDDIHWSIEMEEAWEFIKHDPSVKVSLDLFQLGIVFFRKEQLKEDFIVRY